MMPHTIASATVLILVTALSVYARTDCSGLDPAFYCVDQHTYAWCYGASSPAMVSCASGLVCPCGRTVSNPCTWLKLLFQKKLTSF